MRKYVKNGFIDVTEKSVQSTFNNPSTHDQEPTMRQEWVFAPSMLPDSTDMPKNPQMWEEEFARHGKKLPELTTRNISDFDRLVAKCSEAIERAYEDRYKPTVNPADLALTNLGFK